EKCWPIRQKAVENRASANQAEGHAQPYWADKGSSQRSTPSLWIVASLQEGRAIERFPDSAIATRNSRTILKQAFPGCGVEASACVFGKKKPLLFDQFQSNLATVCLCFN
ncbi:hypothetical protein LEMLEM_LOCUS4577, partial [Lemmus lemmus]